MTADDLLVMPHDVTPAGFDGSTFVGRILARQLTDVEERDLGQVVGAGGGSSVGRASDTVRTPDVAFVRAARLPPPAQRTGVSPVFPDLAVEAFPKRPAV